MVEEKKVMTDAERQAKRRERAAEDGLKSCSLGLVKLEHIDAFKAAAALSREGSLTLEDGQLYRVKQFVRVVEKRIDVAKPVIDLSPLVPLATSRWPLAIAALVGFVCGAGFVFLIR